MLNMVELHSLPALDKLKIIEALWADLANDESSIPNLTWHEGELLKTEEGYLNGSIETIDWQQAKKELRSQFE